MRNRTDGANLRSVLVLAISAPVELPEPGVDLFDTDGFGAGAHGADERTEATVVDVPQDALGAPQDECEGVVGECVPGQAREVELVMDVIVCQRLQFGH